MNTDISRDRRTIYSSRFKVHVILELLALVFRAIENSELLNFFAIENTELFNDQTIENTELFND